MDDHLLPARAAAARLGVKPATLYAYVSRGRLEARTRPGHRGSWFDPVELDAVAGRSRAPAERRPDLRVTSAITRIDGGRYWYRGVSPDALAASRSFEAVVEWLWTGVEPPEPAPWDADASAAARARDAVALLPRAASPTDRLRVVIAVLAAADPLRADLRPAGARATARRLMATAVAALARRRGGSIAAQVA
ncbi:MAG: citrate/2-methylcitrate synthase, partial [Vicinamibacterales bacterium]